MKPRFRIGLGYLLLLGLLLAAFALRVYRLDAVSLRGDESFTVLLVEKPLAQMWDEIRNVEPNPPVLYFTLRAWIGMAGDGEFATRYYSVFWGVLCVALLYRFVREFFRLSESRGSLGSRVGLAAALLIAVNPYQIWHSQDVRNYTLWPALSLLALIFFWQWRNCVKATGRADRWTVVWFFVAELAALYTHYYETFILLGVNLYTLEFLLRRWRTWRANGVFRWDSPVAQWVAANAALGVAFLPFALLLSNRVSTYGEGSAQMGVPLWNIWQSTFSSFTLGETLDAMIRNLAWLPLGLALVAILAVFWKREHRGLFLLLWAGVPTLAVFVLSISRPLFLVRYLNAIAPTYYLLLAYGIALITSSRLIRLGSYALAAFLLALGVVSLGNYFYNPAYAKSPDWRGLARAIDAGARDGDIILQNFNETSLLYYEGGHLPLVVYPEEFMGSEKTVPALNNLNYQYRRIWFIPAASGYWDPQQFVESFLQRHDDRLFRQEIGDFTLSLYSTPVDFVRGMTPLDKQFGNFATLAGYRLARGETSWRLVLYWRTLNPTRKDYDVFISLSDRPGNLLTYVKQPPVEGGAPTSDWHKGEMIVDSYDLPFDSRARTILVAIIDPLTEQSLPVKLSNGGTDESVRIPISP